jgi:HK97 gp10 family phage protein
VHGADPLSISVEKYEVHGLAELRRALNKLPERVELNILSAMARAGAQVVRKDALARLGTADKKSVVLRKRKTRRGLAKYSIGPSGEKFYLMFLELGARPHSIKPKKANVLADKESGFFAGGEVQHPGVTARPWLRPAIDENLHRIVEAMRKRGTARLAKETERLARETGAKIRR